MVDVWLKYHLTNFSFGKVYKVKSRVDGCLYAVKCSEACLKKANRSDMLKEVYALASLTSKEHTHNIVRYHQAWIEDEHLYIQVSEHCRS